MGALGHATAGGVWRTRPWRVDVFVPVAVFGYNLVVLTNHLPRGVAVFAGLVVVGLVLCVVYPARRRHPAGVFAVMLAAATVGVVLVGEPVPADVMLVLTLHHLATRYHLRVWGPAAAAVVAWLLVAAWVPLARGYLNVGDVGVLVLLVVLAATWGVTVRTRRDHAAALRDRAARLERERDARARIAVGEERARIAREMHDVVAHGLSGMILLADAAASTVHTDPERAATAMTRVRDTGRDALAEMRRVLGVLRTDEPGSHAPQPGIAQLGELVEKAAEAGLPARLSVTGEPVPLPAGLDLAVYRIVQEALTNVRKHAGATVRRVDVELEYRPGRIEVMVSDDGTGTSGAPDPVSGGHGLVGMAERVAAYGGTLETGSRPERGYRVLATIPLPEAA